MARRRANALNDEELKRQLDLLEGNSDVSDLEGFGADSDVDVHFSSDFEYDYDEEERIVTLELQDDAAEVFHVNQSHLRPGRTTGARNRIEMSLVPVQDQSQM